MTPNEIKKALECCSEHEACHNCPCKKECGDLSVVTEFTKKAKDEVTYYEDLCGNFVPFVDCRHIDNLEKEMVGGINAT